MCENTENYFLKFSGLQRLFMLRLCQRTSATSNFQFYRHHTQSILLDRIFLFDTCDSSCWRQFNWRSSFDNFYYQQNDERSKSHWNSEDWLYALDDSDEIEERACAECIFPHQQIRAYDREFAINFKKKTLGDYLLNYSFQITSMIVTYLIITCQFGHP